MIYLVRFRLAAWQPRQLRLLAAWETTDVTWKTTIGNLGALADVAPQVNKIAMPGNAGLVRVHCKVQLVREHAQERGQYHEGIWHRKSERVLGMASMDRLRDFVGCKTTLVARQHRWQDYIDDKTALMTRLHR